MNELKVLKKMYIKKNDLTGKEIYDKPLYGFYDFQKLLGLPKDKYESFMVEMSRKGFITINLNGCEDSYARANIRATDEGVIYCLYNSKPVIGFKAGDM